MSLTIVIPIYNVEKYIEKCLLSCLCQDIPASDYEIIVVNDGTKDRSLEIAERIAAEYSNIKIISQENQGLSAARNTGLAAAKGEYIWFIDSDDWIEENCLGQIIQALLKDEPDVLYIGCCWTDGKNELKRILSYQKSPLTGPEALKSGLFPMAQQSIVKSSFMKNNNFKFYEGIYHEDSELTPRIHYKSSKISFLNRVVYFYFQNANSIMGKANPKKSLDLIKVVCPSLSSFADTVIQSDRIIFDNMIAMYINNAFNFICKCCVSDQLEFQNEFIKSSYLIKHLIRSTRVKYKFEGFLFKLFPNNTLSIYRYLSTLSHY